MNCPRCGGMNPQGTAFCGMCGMNLQQSLGTAAAAPIVQQGSIQQPPFPGSASMFPQQQQQQNPPASPPPVAPGYGGLQ